MRGRPPGPPKERVHLMIDQEVYLYWSLVFTDPFTRQLKKGELSELASRLLREEMQRRQSQARAQGEQNEQPAG